MPTVAADAASAAVTMPPFDLSGPLPAERSTTVLEASAGTGKTFALAGLVTRYIAEGAATLDQMLLITFSRSATQELRDRVRRQLVDAADAEERPDHRQRLRDALAAFDAAHKRGVTVRLMFNLDHPGTIPVPPLKPNPPPAKPT